MPLFRPTNRVFSAIAEALGFLESDAATTGYENGPVKPRLDVGNSIQRSAVWRRFIYGITTVGADTTTINNDFYTAGTWDAIEILNRDVGSAAGVVPESHEAIVVGVGARASVDANFTSVYIRRLRTAAIGALQEALFFGDQSNGTDIVTRNATHDNPILLPLPWYFNPLSIDDVNLSVTTETSAAATILTMFDVLSAPVGVFPRIW